MGQSKVPLSVKIFADGADLAGMIEMAESSFISGLTTNPTLMAKAGIKNYKEFALEVLHHVTEKPVSFEVFSDDLEDMRRQAKMISSWANNVYVKIPITNTEGKSTVPLIRDLTSDNIKVNVTAIMTATQVEDVSAALDSSVPSYVSVFAGRIADTGRDPILVMKDTLNILKDIKSAEVIWASPRELLNIFQANEISCHIITATNDILKKLSLVGYDLVDYSLDTVKMFRNDAVSSGFTL